MAQPLARHSRLVLFLVFLLLPGAALAQEEDAPRWTPELSMEFRGVGGTVISPDGSMVAFTVQEPLMEGEQSEYLTHVWVAAADGSWARQYTRGEESASNPTFSPDGTRLLFTTSRSGENQVWALPLTGGEAYQVTDAEEGVGSYEVSPDGSHLAYTMRDPASEDWEAAVKEKRDVIVADTDFRYNHLYMGPFGDGMQEHAHRVTKGDFTVTGWDWAPDGAHIVFSHQSDPRINTGRLNGDISVVNTMEHSAEDEHTFATRELVTGAGVEGSPLVSPDGSLVAYVSTGSQPEPVGLGDIYVVPLAGGEPRKLHDTHDRSGGLMAWVDDGHAVLVLESIGTTRHLQALPVNGAAPVQVTEGAGVMGSADFAFGADRMAFTWQTTDTPPDVYVSALSDWAPEAVTDLHADVPMPEMGRTELLTWRSQDGRFEIEGLLTYPVGYEPGQRVPLVLNVHGGPAGVFSQSFTGSPSIYMIQTFAQEGYAVLRPNPRGSTGYGKDFRYANVRDWGFGDMDDLMAGVDHVIEMGVGDPDQLLLMGWSYGGYMTSFAVTRTDRFKAASMGAGLPNLVSMTTTTDIQDYLVGHMDSEFWEEYETYERHSAIYRIANVTTPTQVIHGENDLRVPFTQGQEFYRALQRRGVPTEMLILPRTPHGPREPKLLMEVTPRILDWFERYLPESAAVTDGAVAEAGTR
ncbi:MAG: S9 family peptidase [Gemmatimonadales bacterium]|jgi:dipeptidyl aminopeptidase/acylaminoacyl peptidase|nr:MAG: S9 family peptidase [Gemmatimonadales bacterium]